MAHQEITRFDLGQTFFEIGDPAAYSDGGYRVLHSLALDHLAQLHDKDKAVHLLDGESRDFAAARRNPNLLPDDPYALKNTFHYHSRLVVAWDAKPAPGEIIGYGIASNSVSGNSRQQFIDRHNPFNSARRRVAVQEIVTDKFAPPDIGLAIGALLMDGFNREQPVWYSAREDHKDEMRLAQRLGLQPALADNGQVTWAGHVKDVYVNVQTLPDAFNELNQARNNAVSRFFT